MKKKQAAMEIDDDIIYHRTLAGMIRWNRIDYDVIHLHSATDAINR